ncbi:MAG TPA: serine hydrolase [Caldilineaceae bacterium]|nr:serine hydrolase [Caldilineaceae bacterium]
MRRFFQFTAFLVIILALFPLYTRFKVAAAPVPPGVYLGGLDLSALKDTDEIRRHLQVAYSHPLDVRFGDVRLVLRPAEVDFRVDADQMVAEAGQYLAGMAFLDIAVREALGLEQQRRDVPVRFMLDNAKLRAWLEQVAAEHNRLPSAPRLLPPTARWADGGGPATGLPTGYVGAYSRDWSWVPGAPGLTLDIEASIPLLVAALTEAGDRPVRLAAVETPPPSPSMEDLAREINSYLMNFPGFGAAAVYDLRSGEEALVDADVSFSGMSTLKIGIVAAVMQRLPNGIAASDPESDLVGQWIDYALGESNNYAANQLLAYLGDGSTEVGAQRYTDFMHSLGFVNTYMQTGYDAQQRPQIPTPGNQRTDWNTNPDPNLQTTTEEMARMMAAIYECMQGRGLLMEVYPGDFTPEECETLLFYMSHDEFQEMIWAGLPRPNQTWIVHKHGFAYESHSDVALVWGPTGPYILSIFLFRRGWMDWGTSNRTMKSISRIVWNFFELQKAQLGLETPAAPVLEPPPGYTPLKEYIKVASTGYR